MLHLTVAQFFKLIFLFAISLYFFTKKQWLAIVTGVAGIAWAVAIIVTVWGKP